MLIRRRPVPGCGKSLPDALFEHPERLDLDLHELAPDGTERHVEDRRLGAFEIFEKLHGPGRHMPVEKLDLALQVAGRTEIAANHPGHHIADGGNMILGLFDIIGARNTKPRKIVTQFGQRLFVEETGQIEGAMGHQLAAAHSVEQLVEFFIGGLDRRSTRRSRESGDGFAKRRVVAFEASGNIEAVLMRRTRKEMRKQTVPVRPDVLA